ncbi:predicted protein [Naegleria gruberi]|uniref:Predicted protein n=1 Tax=Naegleria gruberi TaxID=5762 RepID=D2VPI2_NAEGR|nr:uncharacterized protein NAEGRDRAFT_70869 [Naegleria gruberi]EFC41213.1 predicted protein [Naegleria gruberi]|eukprot:XP_002673957.1 predicted protein [Naegleria gruberi strain NEG-M]
MSTRQLTVLIVVVFLFCMIVNSHHVHATVSPHNTIKCSLNANPLSTTTNISIPEFLATNLPFPFYDNSLFSYDLMIESLKRVNITHIRIPIHWALLEPIRNQLYDVYLARVDLAMDKLSKNGIKSLFFFSGSAPWISSDPTTSKSDTYPPTSITPYTDRLVWLIERYAKKGLEIVQIWNEVNLPAFWMPMENPQNYTNLLRESYDRVQTFISNTSNPEYSSMKNVKISMAGMAYFSEMPYHSQTPMFYALEPLGAYDKCDIVAYHPYYATPEGSVSSDVYDFETKAKEIAYPLLAKYGKRIFATEWGWSTYTTDFSEQPFISEKVQADYILRRLTILMHLCFDRVYQFAMFDFPTSIGASQRDTYYGMLRNNITIDSSKSNWENIQQMAKPSYFALLNYLQFIGERKQLYGVSNVFTPTNDPGNMHSVTVHNGEGSLLWFYWGNQISNGIKLNSQPIKDMIKLTGYNITSFIVYDPLSNIIINNTLPKDLENITIDVQTNLRIVKFTFSKESTQPENSLGNNNGTNSITPKNSSKIATNSTRISSGNQFNGKFIVLFSMMVMMVLIVIIN